MKTYVNVAVVSSHSTVRSMVHSTVRSMGPPATRPMASKGKSSTQKLFMTMHSCYPNCMVAAAAVAADCCSYFVPSYLHPDRAGMLGINVVNVASHI